MRKAVASRSSSRSTVSYVKFHHSPRHTAPSYKLPKISENNFYPFDNYCRGNPSNPHFREYFQTQGVKINEFYTDIANALVLFPESVHVLMLCCVFYLVSVL